jgi:hypothetical protein
LLPSDWGALLFETVASEGLSSCVVPGPSLIIIGEAPYDKTGIPITIANNFRPVDFIGSCLLERV